MNILQSSRVRLMRIIGLVRRPLLLEEEKSWSEFWKEVWHAKWVLIVIMSAMWCADHAGWLIGFETSHLDTLLRMHPRQISKRIVLVEITKDDYHDPALFNGTSPLDRTVMLDLVKAVKSYNPSVIGVDLDTTEWNLGCKKSNAVAECAANCSEVEKKLQEVRQAMQEIPNVVWAVLPQSVDPPLELSPVLGGLPLAPDSEGIPQFPIDADGSVRHFESRVEVAKQRGQCPQGGQEDDGKCYVQTFAQAVLKKYDAPVAMASTESIILRFYGDRYQFNHIDSRQFLKKAAKSPAQTEEEFKSENTRIEKERSILFANKIVLIGGAYPEARDLYFTPLGPMQGLELNALAIQTDLEKKGIQTFEMFERAMEVLIAILIIGIFYIWETKPWKAVWLTMLVVPVCIVLSIVFFYHTTAFWFNFIPVAGGMVCHQLYELAKGSAKAQETLDKVRGGSEQVEVMVADVEVTATRSDEVSARGAKGIERPKTKTRAAGGQ